ncbi:MAG: universal stress protein [Acidobacteriota bacterium]
MYKQIYVPLDNSSCSNRAMNMAIAIGQKAGATMVGAHVYAARLHDRRFRAMESGLPEAYTSEEQLGKQRRIHDSLISRGLALISDSYLQTMAHACTNAGLEFRGVSLEGKNWKELVRDIEEHDYDLVVMGAHGMGGTSRPEVGSVVQRVARRIKRDLLVIKPGEAENGSQRVLVCLDGSDRSYGALKRGLQFALKFNKSIEAVAVYDPHLHGTLFKALNRVLSSEARRIFRLQEQERLHERIIDNGLAKIYQSHLDAARRVAAEENIALTTRLLDGKAWQAVLNDLRESPPWLLLVGRTGAHGDDELDIGSSTENLLRAAPCNVLITETEFHPPPKLQEAETLSRAEASRRTMAAPTTVKGATFQCFLGGDAVAGARPEHCPSCGGEDFELMGEGRKAAIPEAAFKILSWDDEAARRLERVPEGFMRDMTRRRVEQYARARGHERVTLEVVEGKYHAWRQGGGEFETELEWAEDARARIQRAPDFIRPIVVREVERTTRTQGHLLVDTKMLDATLRQWGAHSDFHGKRSRK